MKPLFNFGWCSTPLNCGCCMLCLSTMDANTPVFNFSGGCELVSKDSDSPRKIILKTQGLLSNCPDSKTLPLTTINLCTIYFIPLNPFSDVTSTYLTVEKWSNAKVSNIFVYTTKQWYKWNMAWVRKIFSFTYIWKLNIYI